MFVNEVKHQCKWDEKVINRRGLTTKETKMTCLKDKLFSGLLHRHGLLTYSKHAAS